MSCRCLILSLLTAVASFASAEAPRVFTVGELPEDSRLSDLRTLNSYFPFQKVDSLSDWKLRRQEIKRRILVSQGLWPEPTKPELGAVVHGGIDFDDYRIEKVYFESIPGHYVTGSLYRPLGKTGPFPAVLCPHGHWKDARFYDAGDESIRQSIADGAERFVNAARNPIQARCVQLARMGCLAFLYDMTGNCDSVQIGHRPDQASDLDTHERWGFFSVQADLRMQHMMGLQTWNSVRAIDFVSQLPDVDPTRIGVTGASGGGTQSMIIAAIDDRITAAMPCVMASTSMQGGCTCENACLLRIGQGNIDIVAAIAPRPLGLTAADDWTKELKTKGFPDLRQLYAMLGHPSRLTAAFNTHFPHNYNHVNRTVMYGFFNKHFELGFPEPVLERDFQWMPKEKMTVWNGDHPAPSGSNVGASHEIKLLQWQTQDSDQRLQALARNEEQALREFENVVGRAWETLIGRRIDQVGELQYRETKTTSRNGVSLSLGSLSVVNASEQIPMMTLHPPEGPVNAYVVWITEDGKSGLVEDDALAMPAVKLLGDGYTIITADLRGQGESMAPGESSDAQRMWYQRKATHTWERYCGYTYGYNHPMFAQRTHDVLALIKHAARLARNKDVHLIGIGKTAGPIALAARSQAKDQVGTTLVDLDGFQFRDLTRHDSPMFLPGAVMYLDVAGLMSVCAPNRLTVAGIIAPSIPRRTFTAARASDSLVIVEDFDLQRISRRLK